MGTLCRLQMLYVIIVPNDNIHLHLKNLGGNSSVKLANLANSKLNQFHSLLITCKCFNRWLLIES